MQLYINDEKIDFTLEAEKTLADLIGSIEQLLADQKMIIVALSIDNQPFRQADLDQRGDTPLAAIQEIKIKASDFIGLEMDRLLLLKDFFRSLKEGLITGNEGALSESLKGYSEAKNALRFILTSSASAEVVKKEGEISKLFTGTTAGMIRLWDKAQADRAAALCDFFLRLLDEKSAVYARVRRSSRRITKETIAQLRVATGRLSEVSVLLQTGKDGEAMRAIASFTEMAQLFLAWAGDVLAPPAAQNLRIDGVDLASYSQSLNAHLRDLVEAFEKKDYILIGDLCEYEIAPKIFSLLDTIERSLPASIES